MSRVLKSCWKVVLPAALLYLFFVGLDLMGLGFKAFGRDFAGRLIETTSNPFLGLLIGILSTSLVQSSSMTTSMTVAMVSAGALTVQGAVPIILGANIGTSVTNIIVSMGHISRPEEFRRAFAGASIHDMFNCLAVLVFLPLELSFGFLSRLADSLEKLVEGVGGVQLANPIQALVRPTAKLASSLLFDQGVLVLLAGVGLIFLALRYLVKLLRRAMISKAEEVLHKTLFKSTISAVVAGAVITAMVQSSSITTSVIVPLVGAGVLTLEQAFPFTVGANIGTTVTAMLAALSIGNPAGVTVALAHFSFNVCGGLLIYGLPFLRIIPLRLARALGNMAARSRVAAVVYVLLFFFGIPVLLLFLTGAFSSRPSQEVSEPQSRLGQRTVCVRRWDSV